MIKHIQSSQQRFADIGDLLAALFEEKNTYSYMLLNQYQITKLDILEVISHTELEEEEEDSKAKYLQKYTIDLLEKAQEGKIDPVIGRDRERPCTATSGCRS